MGGKASRNKGHGYERSIAIKLRTLYPQACRGDQRKKAQPREADVENTPFRIECKKMNKQPNALAALQQADCDAMVVTEERTFRGDLRPSVAITKKDRGPDLVTMYLDDWLRLVEKSEHTKYVTGSLASGVALRERLLRDFGDSE